jgi:glutamate 5-kinase
MNELRQRIFKNKIQNSKRIVIKIGSARISGNESETNDFLFNLVEQIKTLKSKNLEIIIVSSGAISRGKSAIQNLHGSNFANATLAEKQALAAIGQGKLMGMYDQFFKLANFHTAQVLFGKADLSNSESYQNLKNTFNQLIQWNIIPIVNENDSTATQELNLGDNDFLSSLVTALTGSDLLVILTGVPGFLIENQVVSLVDEVSDSLKKYALGPSLHGTGGMLSKLNASEFLMKYSIPTAILSGVEPNSIIRFFQGEEVGTLISNEKPITKPTETDIAINFSEISMRNNS